MTHFHKVGDRKIGQAVLSMKVNPKLDIIALKLATGDIILHRLISWQRVWTAPKLKSLKATEVVKSEDGKEHVKIADYEWSPDGKILAIVYAGFIEGDKQSYPLNLVASFRNVEEDKEWPSCVVLFDIDANKMLSFINSDLCIRSLCWKNQKKISGNVGLPLDCLDIPYLDLFAEEDEFYQFLGPQVTFKVQNLGMTNSSNSKGNKKSSHRNGYNLKNTIEGYEKVSLYGSTPESVPFHMLLIGSEDNKIDFYAFGLYRLIRIDLNHITPNSFPSQKVTQLWISNDLSVVNAITVPSIFDSVTDLSILPICLLRKKWRKLHAFVRIKSQIDVRLEYLFDSLKEINSIWEDLMAEIDSKLSNYVQRDEDAVDANPFKQRSKKILLQPDEFIEMLVFGEISLNLEKFLTELTEKTLKKLSSTIEISFLDIHKTNINKVQRALFHILSLVNVLKGMSLHDLQFGDLCLSTQLVNSFIRETHSMLQKTVQLQSNLNDSMRKTKAFIRWLYKCTLMVVNNDPNSSFNGESLNGETEFGTGNVLTNQDLNLIMNFLRENSLTNGFKFENVAAFLQKGKAKQTVAYSELKTTTWENDLFDDSDSVGEAANEQPCSLYEHLYKMYEQFEFIFSEEHSCAKKMNDLVKAELEITEAKMVEQIGLQPHAIDYICGSNGEDDFMVALMSELAESFDLYSFTKRKEGEKKMVNKRMVEFTVQEESTIKKLAIDDVKFYNEEFLTVILTSDLKRDELQELKKDVAESTTQEDMSLISDEEMISEEESGSFSVLSKKAATPSKSPTQQTGHQFLVQLAYQQLWEKIEHFPTVLSIDVTAEVMRLRPKDDADELEMEVDETERQQQQPENPDSPGHDSSLSAEAKSDLNSLEETYEALCILGKSFSELIFMRYLGEGPVMTRLAVSGTRKVACLATTGGSRVAVYEMDNDEEEQQEDDMSAENNSNGEDNSKENAGSE